MKKPEEVMEILEAYDLTGSFRQAAALVGCDHKTVAYWVRLRDEAGGMPVVERRGRRWRRCSRRRSMSWSIARTGRSGRTRRTASWSRSAIRDLRGRRGGGWLSPSGGGGRSMAGGRGRGSRSRGCGCSGTMATGRGSAAGDGVVLRVAGVVAVPGGGAVARQDAAVGGDRAWTARCGCSAARRLMR